MYENARVINEVREYHFDLWIICFKMVCNQVKQFQRVRFTLQHKMDSHKKCLNFVTWLYYSDSTGSWV